MKTGRRELWIEVDGVCRDCGLRNALSAEGLPRRHKWYGFRLSSACQGCGGSGRAAVKLVNVQQLVDSLAHKKRRPLTAKQKFVLENRFGLKDGKVYTLREIAEMMGISHQMVAKHEERALEKIDNLVSLTGQNFKEQS